MGQKSLEIIATWGLEEDVAGLNQALAYVTRRQPAR
jgi:hypothetical protein